MASIGDKLTQGIPSLTGGKPGQGYHKQMEATLREFRERLEIPVPAQSTIANDPIWDAKGDIVAASAADAASRLAVGSDGQVLTADSAQALGVKWAPAPSVANDTIWDAKGDIVAATGADAASKLTVGSNDQVLTADSSQSTGLKWGENDRYAYCTAARTSSSTSYADITDLGFSVEASGVYAFEFNIFWHCGTATTGAAFSVNGPGSPTAINVSCWDSHGEDVAGSAVVVRSGVAYDGLAAGPRSSTVCEQAKVVGFLINGSNAGTLAARFASETGTTITVHAGSWGWIRRMA